MNKLRVKNTVNIFIYNSQKIICKKSKSRVNHWLLDWNFVGSLNISPCKRVSILNIYIYKYILIYFVEQCYYIYIYKYTHCWTRVEFKSTFYILLNQVFGGFTCFFISIVFIKFGIWNNRNRELSYSLFR